MAFAKPVEYGTGGLLGWARKTIDHRTAIFRQINKERALTHHDALEFPDGQVVLLTRLGEGQEAVVLQVPAHLSCRDSNLNAIHLMGSAAPQYLP